MDGCQATTSRRSCVTIDTLGFQITAPVAAIPELLHSAFVIQSPGWRTNGGQRVRLCARNPKQMFVGVAGQRVARGVHV